MSKQLKKLADVRVLENSVQAVIHARPRVRVVARIVFKGRIARPYKFELLTFGSLLVNGFLNSICASVLHWHHSIPISVLVGGTMK